MNATTLTRKPKFPLGQVVITANAQIRINPVDVRDALCRHVTGDWGDVGAKDRKENELSLKEGNRLMSVYGSEDERFWIITEWDRSVTTVLLPLDY